MLAVCRKELKLYFGSFFSYTVICLTLLLFGILSYAFNLFMGYASLAFPLGYMGASVLLFSSLLTLSQYLRERRGDSEKLLFSLPVASRSIVFGRFFASLAVMSIPTPVIALLPLLFSSWGGNAISTSEMCVLGYFLLCALMLSVSQYFLFRLKKKRTALIFAIAMPLLLYAIHYALTLLDVGGVLGDLLLLLDPLYHFFAFTYGNLNLPSLLYMLSLSLLFLLLSILNLKQRRGESYAPRIRLGCKPLALILVALILVFNIGALFIPDQIAKTDISGLNIFRISGKTADLARELDEEVTIYYLSNGGEKTADSDLHTFLKKYTWESDKIRVEIVDTEKNPDFIKAYTESVPSDQSMLVVSEKRHYVVDFDDLYYYKNDDIGITCSPSYYSFLLQTFMDYMQGQLSTSIDMQTLSVAQQLFYSTSTVAYFSGESAITNAIGYVTSDNISNIYVLMEDDFSIRQEYFTYFQPNLLKNGYCVRDLTSLEKLPSDCDILFVFPLKKDLKSEEAEKLSAYLNRGGKLFLLTETHPEFTNFYSVLSEYGLGEEEKSNLLCEGNEENVLVSAYNIFYSEVKESEAIGSTSSSTFVSILPHSIVLSEREGVSLTSWITTTEKGYLVTEDNSEAEEDEEIVYGAYTIGALAEKDDTRIVWLSSPLSLSYTMGENLSSGTNYSILLSAFEWLNRSPYEMISINATEMVNSAISINDSDLFVWMILFTLPLPVGTLVIGGIYVYVRKKK